MSFYEYFLIGFGGALGSIFRAILSKTLPSFFVDIPTQILTINILGGLLIGIIHEGSMEIKILDNIKLFCTTGLLGGFTTFSAFTFEAHQLIERQKYSHAVLYIALSVILSIVFFYFGVKLVRMIKHCC